MKLPIIFRTIEQAQNAVLKLATTNLLVAFIATLAVMHTLSIKERTVLVPPYLNQAVSVGMNSASGEYLKSFGLYFVVLLNTVTPKNVPFVADALSSFVDARIYPDIRKKLFKIAAEPAFVSAANSSKFDPANVVFEASTNKVFVLGNILVRDVNGRDDPRPVTWELIFEMREGRPWIVAVDSYDGLEAHTLQWLQNHPEYQKKTEEK